MSNTYAISYELPGKIGGVHKEVVSASSESEARSIVRAHFNDSQAVRIVGGHQTHFGGGRDDRHDDHNR